MPPSLPIYSTNPNDLMESFFMFVERCQMGICEKYGLGFRKSLNLNETSTKDGFVRARLFQKLILKSL